MHLLLRVGIKLRCRATHDGQTGRGLGVECKIYAMLFSKANEEEIVSSRLEHQHRVTGQSGGANDGEAVVVESGLGR